MEFGLFIQGHMAGFRHDADPAAEHETFMDELAAVVAAGRPVHRTTRMHEAASARA